MRDTKEVLLPISGGKVKIYTYLLAKDVIGLAKAEDPVVYLLKSLIVEINGKTEGVFDDLLELRYEDYKAVVEELTKMTAALQEKKT
jgi:hypothetical protein